MEHKCVCHRVSIKTGMLLFNTLNSYVTRNMLVTVPNHRDKEESKATKNYSSIKLTCSKAQSDDWSQFFSLFCDSGFLFKQRVTQLNQPACKPTSIIKDFFFFFQSANGGHLNVALSNHGGQRWVGYSGSCKLGGDWGVGVRGEEEGCRHLIMSHLPLSGKRGTLTETSGHKRRYSPTI